ncbi:putative transcription factor interactor and regulator CCHC(Zn) family [Helianthus annuus]|uniref:Transcription factor interactor and regulator CCHC(Zn) family n=1 Tax=Helianthus annuus TaxID=4232 RepID=A0A9K3DVL0_HELAN|nr:putative transcription factor interactor and regulator CCHC(Zn) family [Helianthus annuus]KAJ0462520.1 putative transcription factor interactor and regulator CCHC(Zn) family [Helianthus annuus]KAJ0642919.1 putative transcription factor interactor and regulator CCHC(Zn) family [Helianthus annuus]KAJ0646783.1 putative transcription factor interactor and regulator CCHC(Zn) family [Helianthus annuus]KAJ0823527.1 putative transcription factor interactor and regulator CCHC(Zn) family [Helianthus a
MLESYESLVTGKIGNPNMTKEDYDQIVPEELELINIKWCMASIVRRAQRFMEVTGRNSLASPDSKLGFDKSKVTCFKCKERGHFNKECPNREVQGNNNPFGDNYSKKAIYHKTSQHPPSTSRSIQIEDGSSKERNKALVVIQEDEGFNWNKYIPKTKCLAMLAGIIKEPEPTVEEVVEDDGEICFDDVPIDYDSESHEILHDTFRSIMPSDMFNSFVGFFSNQGYSGMQREEVKKELVDEIIDVSKEMNAENLADIADKAMMA